MTSAGWSRRTVVRLIRGLIVAVVAMLLLPYLLTPLYRVVDPVSTLMLARWALGKRVERTYVPLQKIAPVLPRTVIASEDGRFCSHFGVDLAELRDAIEEAEDLSEVRGGSTITQQTAKNLFLWPGRSFIRKGLELPLALWMELVLPKRRIMEIYLNIAEWGPNGEFGVEAGARRAFNKSAAQLSAGEAALLTVMLPNPKRRSARAPRPAVRRIAAIVQSRAARHRSIDDCLRPAEPRSGRAGRTANESMARPCRSGPAAISLSAMGLSAMGLALGEGILYKPGFPHVLMVWR
jgi:monofunctional biosynthetic peptidoglycan transglycosylase